MGPLGKSENSNFLANLSSDFYKKFFERTPRGDLPIGMTSDPLPPLGAELESPNNWGQPKKISHFPFPGVEIFATINCQRTSPDNSGSNSRLVYEVLPSGPKNLFHLWDVFLDFWNYDLD